MTNESESAKFRPGAWIYDFYGPDGKVCKTREGLAPWLKLALL